MKRTESERVCSANGCVDFCSVFLSHVPVFHLESIQPLILKVSGFLSSAFLFPCDSISIFVHTALLSTFLSLSHVKMTFFLVLIHFLLKQEVREEHIERKFKAKMQPTGFILGHGHESSWNQWEGYSHSSKHLIGPENRTRPQVQHESSI